MLDSINHEQRLYVLKEGAGFSCLGFDVCDQRMKAMAQWLDGHTAYARDMKPTSDDKGTIEHYSRFLTIQKAAAAKAQKEGSRCPAELEPQLVGMERKRVEVIDQWGERKRFTVGKSMGWMPCHLEIKTARSTGGGACLGPYKSVRVL